MTTTSTDDAWVEDWLSTGRFSTYLVTAGGSRQRALDLYEWNAKLSAAFLHDLSHLEVGLRNAGRFSTSLVAVGGPGDAHWTDPATLLALFPVVMRRHRVTGRLHDVNKTPRGNVERARMSAMTMPHTSPLPGETIAEIMFGF